MSYNLSVLNPIQEKIMPHPNVERHTQPRWLFNKLSFYISKLAYQKWEQAGKPEGRDLEFWLAAEKEFYRSTQNNRSLCEFLNNY
jgi:Protein of unknown function (DUF2934)